MRLFGTQLQWATRSIRGSSVGVPAGASARAAAAVAPGVNGERIKAIGAVLVSVIFLVIGAIVLFTGASDDLKKVATGWMGVVLGYWLR
jgi:hypothetical protein